MRINKLPIKTLIEDGLNGTKMDFHDNFKQVNTSYLVT